MSQLNPDYVEMSKRRIEQDAPMFNKIDEQRESVTPTQESLKI